MPLIQRFIIFFVFNIFEWFFFFRPSLSFKRQKSEKNLANLCVQNKSQTVGVRVVKTEKQTRTKLLTKILRCSMKLKMNELDYLESSMNHRRTSRTLKSIIQLVKWKKKTMRPLPYTSTSIT